jgi:hypothetical protein
MFLSFLLRRIKETMEQHKHIWKPYMLFVMVIPIILSANCMKTIFHSLHNRGKGGYWTKGNECLKGNETNVRTWGRNPLVYIDLGSRENP